MKVYPIRYSEKHNPGTAVKVLSTAGESLSPHGDFAKPLMKFLWNGCLGTVIGALAGGMLSALVLYPFLKPEHKSADLERLTFYIVGVALSMLCGAVIGAIWRIWRKLKE
jgi:ABC-type Fe3+-siderophore transport system permease subunit